MALRAASCTSDCRCRCATWSASLVVIPLVTHGVTPISRLQLWTQPVWLVMLVLPFVAVLHQEPGVLAELHDATPAAVAAAAASTLLLFGAATTVGISLITQMGEQADYLRFMPEQHARQPACAGGPACWSAGRAGSCRAC